MFKGPQSGIWRPQWGCHRKTFFAPMAGCTAPYEGHRAWDAKVTAFGWHYVDICIKTISSNSDTRKQNEVTAAALGLHASVRWGFDLSQSAKKLTNQINTILSGNNLNWPESQTRAHPSLEPTSMRQTLVFSNFSKYHECRLVNIDKVPGAENMSKKFYILTIMLRFKHVWQSGNAPLHLQARRHWAHTVLESASCRLWKGT